MCSVSKSDCCVFKEDVHHPPLHFELNFSSYHNKVPKNHAMTYNFKKADFISLYSDLCNKNFGDIYKINNVNEATDHLYDIISNSVSRFVPMKKTSKKTFPPWFTKHIITDIRRKEMAWRIYKKSSNTADFENFKLLRTKLKRDIDTSYKNYLQSIEYNLSSNPKSFWAYVNSKKNSSSMPNSFTHNDNILDNPEDIANSFANFFRSAYIPSSRNINFSADTTDNINIATPEITEKDVVNAFKKIKPKFTAGPDGLPAFFLKDCSSILAAPLAHIFNLSLQTCAYPDKWKSSKICPIHKKDSKSDIQNYRPITIINNFGKVFEIVLHSILYPQLHQSISNNQHGFVSQRSTTTNLLCITQFLSEVMDEGGQVDVIYMDFSKAFDRLDHGVLLTKLVSFGFNFKLIHFFESYLLNRSQFVQFQGHRSNEFISQSGVPQGSVLGPLLFIIFINDIVIDLRCTSLLYADDLKIYYKICDESDCNKLQADLSTIHEWCNKFRLSLNINKCNVVSFTRKLNKIQYEYTISGANLVRRDSFKDLGVTFDSHLSFREHTSNIVTSSFKMLGFLIRNARDFQNASTLKSLYNTLVRSRLEYASMIW